ncbi:hypothetical protein [Clostridium gasigenes]|uniref:hypothetical protein n=1 Tax=Clostridium gasigenes TaxID=94869 RepID=UPI001C0BB9CA|nr:hypothetical protein [Clostridium gasigenes]MBU3109665.1 hypothetical protein [Clostridium gasigenes]
MIEDIILSLLLVDLQQLIYLKIQMNHYYEVLKKNIHDLNEFKPIINKIIAEYLLVGGYPEYFECSNILKWQKRLVDDIVGRGLYRGIVRGLISFACIMI